jgi:hypothetical protein
VITCSGACFFSIILLWFCDWVGENELTWWWCCSKFFGQANGAKGKAAPTQQTKLSFSTKGNSKKEAAAEKAEEVSEEEVVEKVESDKGMFGCGGKGRECLADMADDRNRQEERAAYQGGCGCH